RKRARVLSRAIFAMRDAFDLGETSTAALEKLGNTMLGVEDTVSVEYLAVMDPETLEPAPIAATGSVIAIAARVGTTRLIDNVILGAADSPE
ncbi:MAG: pantoate--beta-alanine ligase, partial [Gemmatimonadota bacterium]|nr:pantoate--beta-alanine ligase [Gemmatimonadota bacterium]